MSRRFVLVLAVWHIIVGGWIIFWNGERWCIACREMSLTVLGVIALALGVIALINGLRSSDPMPG